MPRVRAMIATDVFKRIASRRVGFAILLLLQAVAPNQRALALDPGKRITQYMQSAWQTDDGLPELAVQHILETSDGYLWVGTQWGLARFDGLRFTVFDHTNTPALRADYIRALAQDRRGTLWIGTDAGLASRSIAGHFALLTADDGLVTSRIMSLAIGGDGSLWAGGVGGLNQIKDGKIVKKYTAADGLASDDITSLQVDKDGSVWIGTEHGLNLLRDGIFAQYLTKDGLPSDRIRSLYLSRDREIWVQTIDNGFARHVGDHFEPWNFEGLPAASMLRGICEDRDHNLWVGTNNAGLFRIHAGHVSQIGAKIGLGHDQVRVIYEDKAGNLWVGTSGGLIRLRDGSFTTYTREDGLTSDATYSVLEDPAGDVWIGTIGGLNRLGADGLHTYTTVEGLSGNDILALAIDHDGGLWVGTDGPFLTHIVGGRVTQTLALPSVVAGTLIFAIHEDRDHRLWIGTDGGLIRYTDGKFITYTTADGLSDNNISAIIEDAAGTLWAGTRTGFDSIHDGRIESFTAKNGFANGDAQALFADTQGVLWIGTSGQGLFRFEQGRFTRYSTQQGLPDDTINSILQDAQQNMWLGTNKGVVQVSRHELDDVAVGAHKNLRIRVFDRSDGMKSSETTVGRQPSAWRGRDGRLWFTTVRGVVAVDPAHLASDDLVPPTYIEAIYADEHDVNLADPLSLAAGTRRFDIHYTAPNLSLPEHTRFRYRLSGLDDAWVNAGIERVAHYTNVPPGQHRFQVEASNSAGMWSADGATLDFRLTPMFYETWWFRLACGGIAAILLWLLYYFRFAWLRMRSAVAEERQRLASEIHDSLAQGFSGISLQIEAALGRLERAPGLAAGHLRLARDLSRTSLNEARRSVWNLRPLEPNQESLIKTITTACQQLTGAYGATLNFQSSGNAWRLNPAAENNMLRITQEAVSNAIHHGKARKITVVLDYAFHELKLEISDDGEGFDPACPSHTPGRGFGLHSMRHRASVMGGRLELDSAPGNGTRLTVRISRGAAFKEIWRGLRTMAFRKGNR